MIMIQSLKICSISFHLECFYDEYIDFVMNEPTSAEVDVGAVDWKENIRQECIDVVINNDTNDDNLLESDEEEEVCGTDFDPPVTISASEALSLPDQVHDFASRVGAAIENVIRIVGKLQLNDLKQKSINHYFSKK